MSQISTEQKGILRTLVDEATSRGQQLQDATKKLCKCESDIKTIHHIALNPLDCDIAHQDEDSLTVKLVKNMAYLIRKDGK